MSGTVGPAEMSPGDVVRHRDTGALEVLARRKTEDIHRSEYGPGWWVVGSGGLADVVIEESWEYVGTLPPLVKSALGLS